MSDEQEIQLILWYNEEDWDTYRELFSDAHLLPATYEQWRDMAEQQVQAAEAAGTLVAKITIDTTRFPAWCAKQNLPLDAESRTRFAIEIIQRQQMLNQL